MKLAVGRQISTKILARHLVGRIRSRLITISVQHVLESIRTGGICVYNQTTVQNYRRENDNSNNTKQESRKND